MDRHAGAFASGIQTFDDVTLDMRSAHPALVVGGDAAHVVMAGRHDRDGCLPRLDAEVGGGEVDDLFEFFEQLSLRDVLKMQQHIVLSTDAASLGDTATFEDLFVHALTDQIARGEVLHGRRVALHEAFAVAVGQIATFAAGAFGDQDAQTSEAGRVKLDKFEVLDRQAFVEDNAEGVTGVGLAVGGDRIIAPGTARGEYHDLGVDDVDLA